MARGAPPAPPTVSALPPTPVQAKKARKIPMGLVRLLVLGGIGLLAYGIYLYRERRLPYEWSGTVEARYVQVGSRTAGRVKDVRVHEGDHVKAGQVLVTLEAFDLLAQKAGAEADLAMAEASLLKLRNGSQPEQIAEARARLAAQKASYAQADLRLEYEARELKRTTAMVESGAVAGAELDARRNSHDSAQREKLQASARVSEARASLALLVGGTREEDLKAGEAAVAAARAKVASLADAISELEVRAARDSSVETVNVRPGSLLPANAAAVTLVEATELFVRIYVPETQIGRLTIGQEVPISVDSFPGRTFKGKIEHINAIGEYTPRNLTTIDDRANEVFAARVGILEGAADLRAGMVAYIHVPKK